MKTKCPICKGKGTIFTAAPVPMYAQCLRCGGKGVVTVGNKSLLKAIIERFKR